MNRYKISQDSWCIEYDHYDPEDEGRRESLFALGNGFVVSRAAAPESVEDDIHYPGTYRVGCYNRLTTVIEGKKLENESLVNLPNWLPLAFRVQGGKWFSLDEVEILHYRQELNMKEAVLRREVQFCDGQGRKTTLRECRFVSMAHPHLLAMEIALDAGNWSGELEVKSAIDGNVQNNNVERYAPFNKRHLEVLSAGPAGKDITDIIVLKARTVQSGISVALAARTSLQIRGREVPVARFVEAEKNSVAEYLRVNVEEGDHVVIQKMASFSTSRDLGTSECSEEVRKSLARASDFAVLFSEHVGAWQRIWRRCRLDMDNKGHLCYFRLHMFQIMQNISPHTADQDVGVPPSGWQGEEYHGHIFWDELFIFPFLALHFPTIARSLLLYRYRRLNEARHLARQAGYQGAMFPWRSAGTGREETPALQFNLLSGHWMEDNTNLQRHIGAIIACNISYYVQQTNDQEFLTEYGAEMLLEIARFWASIARYNSALGRFEIHGVVGPDEYHTTYPGADTPGISNNSFTNVMAAWALRKARQVWDALPPRCRQSVSEKIALKSEEPAHWLNISQKMRVVFLDNGVLSQFEGFNGLKEFNLQQFRAQHGRQRIDWTLEARGDAVERYKVAKQADTSLLLYLFTPDELREMLAHMGYAVDGDQLKRTVDYYLPISAHESSLSRIVHAAALKPFDQELSWEYFHEAQLIDLLPGEDASTSEGIHLGAMGGTLGILQHHFLGLTAIDGILEVNPKLPHGIKWVTMGLFFCGIEIECEASHSSVSLRSVDSNAPRVKVKYRTNSRDLYGDETVTFELAPV